jgi:hypothetical protein
VFTGHTDNSRGDIVTDSEQRIGVKQLLQPFVTLLFFALLPLLPALVFSLILITTWYTVYFLPPPNRKVSPVSLGVVRVLIALGITGAHFLLHVKERSSRHRLGLENGSEQSLTFHLTRKELSEMVYGWSSRNEVLPAWFHAMNENMEEPKIIQLTKLKGWWRTWKWLKLLFHSGISSRNCLKLINPETEVKAFYLELWC